MPEMPNSYISIPYNNVDFVISGDYVLETRPCSLTECNLDSIDWSLSKKIDFSSYSQFDQRLMGRLNPIDVDS